MKTIELNKKYGPVITEFESSQLSQNISDILDKSNDKIVLNFKDVIAMTTKAAKNVFGSLYLTLGKTTFNERISILNASNTLKEIIYDSILNSLQKK